MTSGTKDKADNALKQAEKAAREAKKAVRLKDRADKLRAKLADVERKLGEAATAALPHVSPFARPFPDLPVVKGVRFSAAETGVRYKNRRDVMLAEIEGDASIAGVFTRSATRSAPVDWCKARLAEHAKSDKRGKVAFVVNAGNANAFTGAAGMAGVETTAAAAAKAIGGAKSRVYIASTGVIGEPLPAEKIAAKMGALKEGLSPGAARDAAEAILTTDTFAKGASQVVDLDGTLVSVAGFAKGSGMIAPDMATMLAFVFTDAPVAQKLLQSMLTEANKISFNAATVDSDTSTSDTVLLAATGRAGGAEIKSRRDPRAEVLEAAIRAVLVDLAQQVVRDGEGISKFVSIKVTGAASDDSAAIVARSIANSPLVKTAIAGADPNWGRIVMAVGKSGEPADRDCLSIRFGDVPVAENGWVSETYSEKAGAAYMAGDEIEIGVDLGLSTGQAEVWTCDLTHRYIEINADYRS